MNNEKKKDLPRPAGIDIIARPVYQDANATITLKLEVTLDRERAEFLRHQLEIFLRETEPQPKG